MKKLQTTLFNESHYPQYCLVSQKRHERNPWIVAYLCLLDWLLEGKDYELETFDYCDKTNRMVLLICRNIRDQAIPERSHFDFLPILEEPPAPTEPIISGFVEVDNRIREEPKENTTAIEPTQETRYHKGLTLSRLIVEADTQEKREFARTSIREHLNRGRIKGNPVSRVLAGIRASVTRLAN